MVAKENPLDGHIHRHIHELAHKGGLGSKRSRRLTGFSKFLIGLFLGAIFVGALWLQWLK